MLKIYWGTQKVIRLKKEELSWKRKSTRIAYENGLDEKLMSAMGSGAKNRRSLTRLQDSFSELPDSAKEAETEVHGSHDEHDRMHSSTQREPSLDAYVDYSNKSGMKRNEGKKGEVAETVGDEEGGQIGESLGKMRSGTMPRKCSLQRRTMSFSGHLYNSKVNMALVLFVMHVLSSVAQINVIFNTHTCTHTSLSCDWWNKCHKSSTSFAFAPKG